VTRDVASVRSFVDADGEKEDHVHLALSPRLLTIKRVQTTGDVAIV
jgi:hypothetical protein